MDLFYSPEIKPGSFTFKSVESKHIIRVLRRRKGDEIILTNGRGDQFKGTITDDNPNKCLADISESKFFPNPSPVHIHIAVAPTKNISRFEWFIEKATEIGINEISPMDCDHSERIKFKVDRLEKIMISALKQSQQFWLPKLNYLTSFEDILKTKFMGQKFIAYVDFENETTLKSAYQRDNDCVVLIGPEGDFSRQEVQSAISAGFTPISLGANRLRTETAALVACHTINLMNQ